MNFAIFTLEPPSHVRIFLLRLGGEANEVAKVGGGGGGGRLGGGFGHLASPVKGILFSDCLPGRAFRAYFSHQNSLLRP